MKLNVVAPIVLLMMASALHAAPKPSGVNCNLKNPPKGAVERPGFEIGPSKKYPVRKNRANNYTGCVAFWGLEGGRWQLISLTHLASGQVTQFWWADPNIEPDQGCFYQHGTVVTPNKSCLTEVPPE